MSKRKLLEAQGLIKAKRYEEARKILETVNHPKATDWLLRLEQIAPIKRRNRRTIVLTVIVLAALVVALVMLANSVRNIQQDVDYQKDGFSTIFAATREARVDVPMATVQSAEETIIEAEATLASLDEEIRDILTVPYRSYCESLEERSRGSCVRWTDIVLAERLDETLACYEEYDSIFDKDSFTTCLLFFGISPISENTFMEPLTIEDIESPDFIEAVVNLELYCQDGFRNETGARHGQLLHISN
jgi:predicted Holliday junction resolvase-like endonuclease